MTTQEIKLYNLKDLYRFYRYVRRNRIHGTVRQNAFAAKANNYFMLALAIPLDSARLEISSGNNRIIPEFEIRLPWDEA